MFKEPVEVSDLDMAFPAHVIGKLIPAWEDIPAEYKRSHPYRELAETWFFTGLRIASSVRRPGVDGHKAVRHIQAVLGSYEPKHEHKIAGVAYLIDAFFSKFEAGAP